MGMKVRSHAAFDNLLSVSGSAIFEAFVLSRKNVSRDGKLTYLPLYMSFCLGELVEREDDATDFRFAPVALHLGSTFRDDVACLWRHRPKNTVLLS